jgi:preprotein translocase SecE subunit
MAKSRAQRKAERRAREAQAQRQGKGSGDDAQSRAQHDTQVPRSGDIAEIEAVEAGMAAGAPEGQLETPDAPHPRKPSRAERRAEEKKRKQSEKRKQEDAKRREREQISRKQKQAQADRGRGGVIGFLVSCWQELKKVQWPDRETLIQATAVTIIFVAVAAAYLGALDAAFNFLIKRIL